MGLIDGMSVLGVILMVAGFILVGIEMVLPGFSIPGISGIVCLIISIFINAGTIQEGIILTLIVIALLGLMLGIILWLLSKGKIAKPIILTEEQNKEKGYISSNDLKYLLNKKGVAYTDLRPSGVGDFDGINFDVISNGSYISKGTPIIIYEVSGSKLIVKEIKK
ncbi:MAG: serine protease [Cellulosilyticum sp.]|nr:serine protease [Cellulosilyticum sp.]